MFVEWIQCERFHSRFCLVLFRSIRHFCCCLGEISRPFSRTFVYEIFSVKCQSARLCSFSKNIQSIFLVNNQRLILNLDSFELNRIGHILVFIAIAIYIGVTTRRAANLISLIGIFMLIILGTLGSKYPHRVDWKVIFL